jgi:hypothetical protein
MRPCRGCGSDQAHKRRLRHPRGKIAETPDIIPGSDRLVPAASPKCVSLVKDVLMRETGTRQGFALLPDE